MAITPTIAQGSLLFNLAFRPALFHIPPHPLHSPYPIKKHAYPQQNAPNLTTASKAHAHTELTASSLTNVLTAEVDTQLHPATTSLPKTSLTYRLQVRCLHDCILVPILSSPRAHKKKGERVTLNSCCSTVDCGCVRNFRESVRIWPVDAT